MQPVWANKYESNKSVTGFEGQIDMIQSCLFHGTIMFPGLLIFTYESCQAILNKNWNKSLITSQDFQMFYVHPTEET